jgi:hypothetical protein
MSAMENIDTIYDFNSGLDIETLHPLISVINFPK